MSTLPRRLSQDQIQLQHKEWKLAYITQWKQELHERKLLEDAAITERERKRQERESKLHKQAVPA